MDDVYFSLEIIALFTNGGAWITMNLHINVILNTKFHIAVLNSLKRHRILFFKYNICTGFETCLTISSLWIIMYHTI